jgi:hypothetical protein
MALIDKASLLMVPSTYEAGKLYNVLPSGNRAPDNKGGAGYDQTRADFDFDRGSNTAATRIDSNGVLQKYRENELLQSNQFDTTWANSNTTETGGQEDKDGGTDAWLLTKSAVASGYIAQTKSTSGVSTASVYVKAGTIDTITLWCNQVGGGNPFGTFNLATQTLTDSGTIVDSNITSVGIDWYRVSITFSVNTTLFRIYVNNFSDTTAGSIYIQDAQLESGLVSTDYLESTSVTGKAGVLVDLPRINYDANGENGALLLEPSRQQLIQYSEYFGASSWALFGQSSLGSSFVQSPEGLSNAYTLNFNTSNESLIYYNYGSGSATFTTSVWARSSTGKKFSFRHWDGSAAVRSSDFTTTTEWKRFDFTFTSPIVNFGICNESAGGLGNVEIYGFQAELGSYPSSYIPNHGESGGVTRAADSCSVTGASDVIGQTEGTLFVEYDQNLIGQLATRRIMALSNGTTSNRIVVYVSSSNKIDFYVRNSSGQLFLGTSANVNTKGMHKIAAAYKDGDYIVYLDGSEIISGSGSSGTIPSCSRIDLGSQLGANNLFEPIYQTALFKTRLTNAELATLTTL